MVQSSLPGSTGIVLDPLVMDVPLRGPEKQERVGPVRIGGLTEWCYDDRLVSVILQSKKPPGKINGQTLESSFRYLLRGAVSQAALAAVNAAGRGDRRVIICCSLRTSWSWRFSHEYYILSHTGNPGQPRAQTGPCSH